MCSRGWEDTNWLMKESLEVREVREMREESKASTRMLKCYAKEMHVIVWEGACWLVKGVSKSEMGEGLSSFGSCDFRWEDLDERPRWRSGGH